MAKSFFSVDVGEKYVKVIDAEKKGNQVIINSAAFDSLPANLYIADSSREDEVASDLIQKLVKDASIKKKNVNVIIPDSYSYAQVLEMPAITEKELLSAIRYQADQFIPIPIDKVNLDIEILSEDKKNKKLLILLVAAPNIILEKIERLVDATSLSTLLIETETSSLLRLISNIETTAQTSNLFLNFGSSSSTIYFLGSDKANKDSPIPYQIRNFPLGLDIFAKELKVNYNLAPKDIANLLSTVGFSSATSPYDLGKVLASPLKELAEQINKFITSIRSQHEVTFSHVYVCGEGYKLASLTNKLSEQLQIPTTFFTLDTVLMKNNVSDFFKNDLPLFMPALGGNLAELV